MPPVLSTIGYESEPQAAVIQRLKDAGVAIVLDVRAVASSRRAGFSKTLLAASLKEAGIDYLHLRDLGTPKAGRDAARAGRVGEMHEIFNAIWKNPRRSCSWSRRPRSPRSVPPPCSATSTTPPAATAASSPSVCRRNWD